MPYFPYSRQSKKKQHRGSITARMIANLLDVAGVNHVIAIDLHASQMQGFFRCPVDNLVAEPLIAQWIKINVSGWQKAVVVSKNPGGTKRVTSLADALKLSFGIVMTDRYRLGSPENSMSTSMIFESGFLEYRKNDSSNGSKQSESSAVTTKQSLSPLSLNGNQFDGQHESRDVPSNLLSPINDQGAQLSQGQTGPSGPQHSVDDSSDDETTSQVSLLISKPGTCSRSFFQLTREVIHGRLIHGHIVEDDVASPATSALSARVQSHRPRGSEEDLPAHMTSSVLSASSSRAGADHGLGGSGDAIASSEDEEENLKNPEVESTVTLVGNVKDKIVFILDDMIDKSASWIAAAETVVKRGGATKVYCLATHGLFGGDCLEEMEDCECIHNIVVTNSFPIPASKSVRSSKLCVLDVSGLLAEAVRRNHHGESISQLFLHY